MASKQEIEIDESLYVKDVDETEGSEETLPESIPLNGKSRVSDFSFALLMQKCGSILLNKKKTNKVKRLKETAMTNVINVLAFENDVILTKNQVYKKINNMKSRVKDKCLSGKKIQLNAGEKIFAALMETVGSSTIPEATGELMDLSGSELALRDQGLLCKSIELNPTSKSQADKTPSTVEYYIIPQATGESMDPSGSELVLRDRGLLCESIEIDPTSESLSSDKPDLVSVIETASNTSSKIVGSNIFGEFTQSNISGVSDDEQLSPKKDREENEIPDLTKHNIEELQKLVLIEQLNVLKAEKKFYEKACYVLGKCSQS
ncbi:uncharacterized protein LOC119082005 isoform X3 [Bradysia coprophila]|uniref:uncharacterized protein LOC119082005 isoform X3 n=1 Tax=Bradysia coprophila TaxID=38358 RepID=UPI00187DAF7E|nr:uncharacterized protein LOC119082005 isoform X3 [Bradysia coprophila]